jgi:hypothetical protein
MSLITGTNLLESFGTHAVNTLTDIRGLLLKVDEDLALVSIKTDVIGGESDVADSVTDNLLVVNLGAGCDFTENHHHVGLGGSLASDLGFGILLEAGIEDGIRDLISELIRVTLVHGLCRKGIEGRLDWLD